MKVLHRRRTTVAILCVASLLAACSGDDGASSTARETESSDTSAATGDTPSAYTPVLDQIRQDGDVTLPTALQASSLAFGDLPGVSLPDGPRDPVVYGCGPLRWIERYWDDLTAEQQAAATPEGRGAGPARNVGEDPVPKAASVRGRIVGARQRSREPAILRRAGSAPTVDTPESPRRRRMAGSAQAAVARRRSRRGLDSHEHAGERDPWELTFPVTMQVSGGQVGLYNGRVLPVLTARPRHVDPAKVSRLCGSRQERYGAPRGTGRPRVPSRAGYR